MIFAPGMGRAGNIAVCDQQLKVLKHFVSVILLRKLYYVIAVLQVPNNNASI